MVAENKTALNWQGKEFKTLADIRGEMININTRQDNSQAAQFMEVFREWFGRDADFTAFYLSGFSETPIEMSDMLTRFLQRDCHGEFHITEAPQDEYGNTAMGTFVAKVRIVEGYQGYPELAIIEPKKIAKIHPVVSPKAWRYTVVDGPARMLAFNEWADLVGFQRSTPQS